MTLRHSVASSLRAVADSIDPKPDSESGTGDEDDPRSESYHALPDAIKEGDNAKI